MIYGDLRFRDRLLRGVIGAVLGGGAGFLLMLRGVMRGSYSHAIVLLAATLLGATIGGILAFRRKRIGW
jgi:drug/metabolite transporter (DMT)-like permease